MATVPMLPWETMEKVRPDFQSVPESLVPLVSPPGREPVTGVAVSVDHSLTVEVDWLLVSILFMVPSLNSTGSLVEYSPPISCTWSKGQ